MPRRAILRKLGRYAAVTPPAVTLLLAATSKPAAAAPSGTPSSSRQFKNRVGAIDGAVLLTTLASVGEGVAIDMIDGVGVCFAAIKALSARLDLLEAELRPASF